MKLQEVEIPETCEVCGASPVILHTAADQREKPEHCSYWALDQEDVVCPECKAKGMVTISDQVAEIVWSEEDAE